MPFSFIEIFGVTLAIVIILLDTQQSAIARPLSILGAFISLYFYHSEALYSKVVSKCIFMVLDVYGWYHWQYGGRNKTTLPVSTASFSELVLLGIAGLFSTFVLGKFFSVYSNAVLPYWDALHTALATIAYWLLVKKRLESWAVWTLANLLFVVVLYSRGIYLFSGLNAFYIILNIHGYRSWRRSYRLAQAEATASH